MPTVLGRNKGFPEGRADWDGLRLVRTYQDSYKVEAENEDREFLIADSLQDPAEHVVCE